MAASDKSSAFDQAVLTADLVTIRGLIRTFFGRIRPEDWERPTESRPTGWTLIQAFCHITAVAELFDEALEAVLDVRNAKKLPINARQELADFNRKQIELRQGLPPEYLLQSFLEALSKTESRIEGLSPADLEKPVPLKAYNRPQSIAELVGNQLSHPVIVHGAQLANGIGAEPLWRSFSPELMQHQLTRFFHVLSHAYWPEKGKGLTAVINFNIRGEGGGQWHIRLADDGGDVGYELVKRPSLTLHFANPDAFCSLFTIQLSPIQSLLKGKVFAWGNIPLAFRLSHLFAPT